MNVITIPDILSSVAALNSRHFIEKGDTPREVILNVCRHHTELKPHLFYHNNQLKEHFLFTRNGEIIGPDTPLEDGSEIAILLAASGGTDGGKLTPEECRLYQRHIALPGVGLTGQRRLKEAKVLIVGTGGLGSPVSLYLAAAGVGTIGLADADYVEASNLHRQVVHGHSTLGMLKVESAKRRLQDLNPHIQVRTHACVVDELNAAQIIGLYDMVVDGTDNFAARYLVNNVCSALHIPFVSGSVLRFEGQVSVFSVGDGPCYHCLYPRSPPPELSPGASTAGVMGILPGVIGMLEATEALKLLLGIGEPLSGRLLRFDARSMTFDELRFSRRDDCPTCSVFRQRTCPHETARADLRRGNTVLYGVGNGVS